MYTRTFGYKHIYSFARLPIHEDILNSYTSNWLIKPEQLKIEGIGQSQCAGTDRTPSFADRRIWTFAFGQTQELDIQNTIQKCNNLVSSLYKSFYLTLLPKCFTFQSPPVENMCKLLEYQSKVSIQRHVGKT